MNGITVEAVKSAYEKTGLKPARYVFASKRGDDKCGCMFTALGVAEGLFTWEDVHNSPWIVGNKVPSHFQLDERVVTGVMHGFDYGHNPSDTRWDEDYFQLGKACAEAVFGE